MSGQQAETPVAPSLDITHDHWVDAPGGNAAQNTLSLPSLLSLDPTPGLLANSGNPLAENSPTAAFAPPAVSSLFTLPLQSSLEDSEIIVISKLHMPPAVDLPAAARAPTLRRDDPVSVSDVDGVSASAADAPLGNVPGDSEELTIAVPRTLIRRVSPPRPTDADDFMRDFPSSQMPEPRVPSPKKKFFKPPPRPTSSAAAVEKPHRRRRSSEPPMGKSAKKARADESESSEAFVDAGLEAEHPQEKSVSSASEDSPKSLFKGFSFILTGLSAPEPTPTVQKPTYAEPDTQTQTQQSQGKKPPEPVKESEELRAEVIAAVLSTGGVVVEKVPEKVKELTVSNCIVLASRAARTQKYFSALLHGIPTVMYTWLTRCIDQGCIIDPNPFFLPAGLSLEIEDQVYHNKFVPNILNEVRVELSGTPQMARLWGELLRVAGARVVFDGLQRARQVDVLVVARPPNIDGTWVAPEVLVLARKRGTPAVTTEWVIQCIINQKRVPEANYPLSVTQEEAASQSPSPVKTSNTPKPVKAGSPKAAKDRSPAKPR